MAVEKGGTAPYAPAKSVLSVIHTYREHSPRVPFTADNITPIEHVNPGTAPRTLQALKLLGLADEDGNPTAALTGLKEAGRNEFQERLAGVVRDAYAEVFAYRDPTTAEPDDIEDAFRALGYSPASMRPRMMRLFYGLCEAAGIISERPKIASKGDRGTTNGAGKRRAAPTASSKKTPVQRTTDRQPSPPPPLTPPTPQRRGLHPALSGLLDLIPDWDDPWKSREARDIYFKAWEAAMDAIHPLPPNGSGSGSTPENHPDTEPVSTDR